MQKEYSREYNPETNHPSGVWAEGTSPLEDRAPLPWESHAPAPPDTSPHERAARGLARMFLLHPMPAAFAILVDSMVSAIDVATLEISAPILWLFGAIVTTVVVWMAQRKWSGDDEQEAFLKAIAVGFLVALPSPFPAWLTVPSAIAGTVQILRRKN